VAALLAFGALYVTGGGSWMLPLFGMLLVATYLFPARLENRPWRDWLIRIGAWGLLFSTELAAPSSSDGFIDARVTHFIGQCCAAELVLESWRRRPVKGTGGLSIIFFSTLVLLAASNTYDTRYIRYFAPACLLGIALALRAFHPQPEAPGKRPRAGVALALGWAALLLALFLGGATHYALTAYRDELTQWSNQLLTGIHTPQRTGMASTPTLGATFDLRGSPHRILRIEADHTDLLRGSHLRGAAFETYSLGSWGLPLDERPYRTTALSLLQPEAPGPRARFTRFTDEFHLLFAPLNARGMAPEPGSAVNWSPEDGGPLRAGSRAFAPYAYTVVLSTEEDRQGPLCVPPGRLDRDLCLKVPREIDPRVRELAERIGGRIADPRGRVRAVEAYLLTHHAYSRTTRPGPGDPISSFLLGRKAAHCQYFAAGAVILLRCLGVPSRYVSGYYAHEGGGPGVMVVRGRDAHAWAESWIEGLGWITVDATPGDGRPDRSAGLVPPWQAAWEWLQDRALGLAGRLASLDRTVLLLLAGIAAAAVAGVQVRRLLRRRKGPAPAAAPYSSPGEELAAAAARFEALLRRSGLSCPPHLPWGEHLEAVAAHPDPAHPLSLPGVEAFVAAYNQVRFGRPEDREALQVLHRLLQQLERAEP
jgi:transglutaminase-like putative cysteine protease